MQNETISKPIAETIEIANAEKRITLNEFKAEIKSEIKRMYGRSSNVQINFLAPKDYSIFLNHKQAFELLKAMEHGKVGGELAQHYDDDNEGVTIRKTFYEGKQIKTTYWIHG